MRQEYTTSQKSNIFVPTIPRILPIFELSSSVGSPYPITERMPANSVSEIKKINRKYTAEKNFSVYEPIYKIETIDSNIINVIPILMYGESTFRVEASKTASAAD